MTRLLLSLIGLLGNRNRKRLKERTKRLVERDRVLQSKLARAG